MLEHNAITTIIAVISLRSLAVSPITAPYFNTSAIAPLYIIAPIIESVVAFINDILSNKDVPIITAASPITTVPVPIPTSAKPWYWAVTAPAVAESALLIRSPNIFTISLFTPKEDTTCSLSPTAISKKPDFVLRYKSKRIFTIINAAAIITIAGTLYLKILFTLNKGTFAFPIILRFIEYNPIIIRIPAIKLSIFNLTCIIPVTAPAKAPPKAAKSILIHGLTPWTNKDALIAAPIGNVPSTDMSGKSNILYVI